MRTLSRVAMVASLVSMTVGTTACSDDNTTGPGQRVAYGASQSLGQGAAAALPCVRARAVVA